MAYSASHTAHSPPSTWTEEDLATLRRRSFAASARRAYTGTFTYPALCVLLALLGAAEWRPVAPFLLLSMAIISLSAYRWLLIRRFDELYDRDGRAWRRRFSVSTLATAVCWGLLIGWGLWLVGTSGAALLALIIAIVSSSVAPIIYSASPALLRTYLVCLWLPIVVAFSVSGGSIALPASLAIAIAVVYNWSLARRIHHELLEASKRSLLFEQRARELEDVRQVLSESRQLFSQAHDAILVLDPATEAILDANPRACEIYGFERSELVGLSVRDISVDLDFGDTQVRLTMEKQQDHHSFETVQRRKDGTELVLEVHASRVMFAGRPAILSINRDITERRQAEEMRLAKEAAERTSQAKSRFVASMSHEIRTPLASLVGAAELLKENRESGDDAQLVDVIADSAHHLQRMVDDVLDFSKIEAQQMAIENAVFELRRVVASVTELMRTSAKAKGLGLHLVWGSSLPGTVEGDFTRLRQVLTNLISNAVKFTEEGEVRVTVEDGGAGRVRFEVADTGIGIPEDAKERLFEEYQQAGSSIHRRFGGTGLGLSISRRLVELMGGEMGYESQVGVGSNFWFAVPLPAVEDQDSSSVAIAVRDGSLSVLVAEDDPITQAITCQHLEALGYRVLTAEDGKEVLAALERTAPDLILMDCRMPGIDGFEAARRIRELGDSRATIPIVALTASAFEGDHTACLEAGMDDYLTKPFRRSALAAALDQWLPDEAKSVSS